MSERRARYVWAPSPSTDEAARVLFSSWAEDDLLAFCRNTALTTGWRVYHTRYSIKSAAGFPDLVLVKPPRVLFCELKREGLRPTRGRMTAGLRPHWIEGQDMWLLALSNCPGVETYWWWPSDCDDIARILTEGPADDLPCVARLKEFLSGATATP